MLKASYKLEQIENAIKKENPLLPKKEIQKRAKSLYQEIIKMDNKERENTRKYNNNVDFSGSSYELDCFLQLKGICYCNGQIVKITLPKKCASCFPG